MESDKPTTITESIKKEGVKGFFKRWGDGIQKIPQDRLLLSEIYGYIGTIIGTIVAGVLFFFWPKMWPISLVMLFNVVITGSQMIGKIQQYKAIKKFNEHFKKSIDINELVGGENGSGTSGV
jgi:hypothetical protein